MPVTQSASTTFSPMRTLGSEYLSADRHYWDYALKDLVDTNYYSITKQFMLHALICNFKKKPITNDNRIFDLYFQSYRRIDTPETVAHWIKTRSREENQIYFISKTSISGRQVATIANIVNLEPHLTLTEETATSLYLQTDNSHPVRVFKLTNNNDSEAINYFIIGSNQMFQNIYYTCLALVPKWFPKILDGINDTRKEALIKLFTAIGRMNDTDYYEAISNCFDLLYEPEEAPIDFSTMTNFLKSNIQDQINRLQNNIDSYRRNVDSYLLNYQEALKTLQYEQRKLTVLLSEPKQDDSNIITDAQNCKSIVDYYVRDNKHIVTIKSKMLIDSKAIITKILSPDNTNAQYHYNICSENARRLFEDLWIKDTLQIHFCTTFHKQASTGVPSVSAPKRTKATKNTMPNPHLLHFSCFGNNKKLLIDAATDNNLQYYLGALTACNSNLNTGDATVLRRFCNDLLTTYLNTPVIYDVETKTYTTPNERMKSYETV